MTTPVATIISDAYRELNVTAIGTQPTDAQAAEGLGLLNTILLNVMGFEVGELLQDWQTPQPQRTAPVAANYPQLPYPIGLDYGILPAPYAVDADMYVSPFPPQNSRVIWGGNTMTVYFPEQPDNGARMMLVQGSGLGDNGQTGNVLTIDANGRFIGAPGQAQQQFIFDAATPFAEQAWIYFSERGFWVPLAGVAATDNMPFAKKHDDFWRAYLAIRVAPRYNKTPSAETKGAYLAGQAKLEQEFKQSGVTVYGSWEFPRSLQSFNTGRWNY